MLRKLLFIFIILFVVTDIFLLFFFVSSEMKTSINFISLTPGFSWDISKNNKDTFQRRLVGAGAINNKIVVVVSPRYEVTSRAAGWGDNKPVYYGKWNNMGNYEVLTIYIDKNELEMLTPDNRTKLLNLFVTREIINKAGVKGDLDPVDQL